MSSSMPASSNVGIISIGVTTYCLILASIQICIKHEASKIIIGLSTSSSLIMSIASACIALTYYLPRLWSKNQCYCHPLWSTSLNAYVAAVYTIKCIYVARVHLISKDSVLGTPATKRSIQICIMSLVISSICCFSLMIYLTDGTCHTDVNIKGCIANFHVINIQLAMGMLVFDAMLYAGFCYKWYKIMEIFKMSDRDHKIPKKVIRSFIIQFSLTLIALTSCFLDGVAHLLIHNDGYNYHNTMVIFLADCTIVATCNFLMISETQQLIKKLFCFCCRSSSTSSSSKGELKSNVSSNESTGTRSHRHSVAVKKHAVDHSVVVAQRRISCTNTKESEGSKMSDAPFRYSTTTCNLQLPATIPQLHAKNITDFDEKIAEKINEKMDEADIKIPDKISESEPKVPKATREGSISSMDSYELSGHALDVIMDDIPEDTEQQTTKDPELPVISAVDSGLSHHALDAIMEDIDDQEEERQRQLELAKLASIRSGLTNFSLPEEDLNAMMEEIDMDQEHTDIEIVYDETK